MLDIQDPIEARKVIRENKYTEQTAGTANKFVKEIFVFFQASMQWILPLFAKKTQNLVH